MSPEKLLAENRELKKHVHELKSQLESGSGTSIPALSEAAEIYGKASSKDSEAAFCVKALQENWVLVALGMQMVYLCVLNASLIAR